MASETGGPPYESETVEPSCEEGGEGGGTDSKNAAEIRLRHSAVEPWMHRVFQSTQSTSPSVWRVSSRRSQTGWRAKVSCVVKHPAFDFTMCLIVVANSLAIGLEQAWRLEDRETTVFDQIEHIFLAIYILELTLRIVHGGLECLHNNWVRFDMAIVATGMATNWVLVPIVGARSKMSSLLVLRMTRLLRLARTLKLVIRCRELLMLVQGLVNSVSTMFYTLVLCIIILYVLACMSLELITLPSREGQDHYDEDVLGVIDGNFRSLPMAMLSLVQFITFDNVVYVYKPLIEADASLAIFFMSVIMVMGVVFMNLVTAIIVNSAVEQAMQDKDVQKSMVESKRKKLIMKLKDAFYRADADGSGEITREELKDIDPEDQDLLKKVLGIDDLTEVFDQLDVDGDGDIGIEEFCTGIERIVISETSIEFKRMERMMNSMHKQLKALHTEQDGLRCFLEERMSSVDGPLLLAEPVAGAAANAPKKMPTPSWVGELALELKEACSADVRCAMDEACKTFMAQVCDSAVTPPETPRAALGAASDASSCCSPRGTWEALPPAPPGARPAAGQRPEAAATKSGGRRPETARAVRRGCQGQDAAPKGARGPVLGGFVPKASKPLLMCASSSRAPETRPSQPEPSCGARDLREK